MAFASIPNGINFATLPTFTGTPTTSTQFANYAFASTTNFAPLPTSCTFTYAGTILAPIQFSVDSRYPVIAQAVGAPLLAVRSFMTFEPLVTTLDYGNIQVVDSMSFTAATLTSLSAANLLYSTGGIGFSASLLTSMTFTNLISASNIGFTAPLLTTVSFPALVGSANFSPVVAACTSLSVSALTYANTIAGTFTALTSMSFPAIVNIGSTITFTVSTAPNLVTFSLGSTLKYMGGNFTFTGAKLNQASVDGILVSLAALDGTNGTTAYSSKTINLSGGTNATPSATGLTAKATLEARSCTVTVN